MRMRACQTTSKIVSQVVSDGRCVSTTLPSSHYAEPCGTVNGPTRGWRHVAKMAETPPQMAG